MICFDTKVIHPFFKIIKTVLHCILNYNAYNTYKLYLHYSLYLSLMFNMQKIVKIEQIATTLVSVNFGSGSLK